MESDAEATRKQEALSAYRAKLLQHKERTLRPRRAPPRARRPRFNPTCLLESEASVSQELDAKVRALREEVKKTRKEFDKSEEDLKALQSVGQIIGEVLRQLDAERCASSERSRAPRACSPALRSHREGVQRAALRGGRANKAGQGEADAGHARGARHDDADNHARAAARGAPRLSAQRFASWLARTELFAFLCPRLFRSPHAQVDPVVFNMLHETTGSVRQPSCFSRGCPSPCHLPRWTTAPSAG